MIFNMGHIYFFWHSESQNIHLSSQNWSTCQNWGLPEILSQSDIRLGKVILSGVGQRENSLSSPNSSGRYKIGTEKSYSSRWRAVKNFVTIGAWKSENCDAISHKCVDLYCFIVQNSYSLILEPLCNNRSGPKIFFCRDRGIPVISSHFDSWFWEKYFYRRFLKKLMPNEHQKAF